MARRPQLHYISQKSMAEILSATKTEAMTMTMTTIDQEEIGELVAA